jgi:hypothetical protein
MDLTSSISHTTSLSFLLRLSVASVSCQRIPTVYSHKTGRTNGEAQAGMREGTGVEEWAQAGAQRLVLSCAVCNAQNLPLLHRRPSNTLRQGMEHGDKSASRLRIIQAQPASLHAIPSISPRLQFAMLPPSRDRGLSPRLFNLLKFHIVLVKTPLGLAIIISDWKLRMHC